MVLDIIESLGFFRKQILTDSRSIYTMSAVEKKKGCTAVYFQLENPLFGIVKKEAAEQSRTMAAQLTVIIKYWKDHYYNVHFEQPLTNTQQPTSTA